MTPTPKLITFPKLHGPPWYVGKNTWRKLTPGQRIEFQAIRDKAGKCSMLVEAKSVTLKVE